MFLLQMRILYSSEDDLFVDRLARDLNAAGFDISPEPPEYDNLISLAKYLSGPDAPAGPKYFGFVLSPNSVSSDWVQLGLPHLLRTQEQLPDERKFGIVPMLLPGSPELPLPGRLWWADFQDPSNYDSALESMLKLLNVDRFHGANATLSDRYATRFGRVSSLSARPKQWHCIFCGWKCDESFNDYMCKGCGAIRPFVGGSATMKQCSACRQMNLLLAPFCEWCGAKLPV